MSALRILRRNLLGGDEHLGHNLKIDRQSKWSGYLLPLHCRRHADAFLPKRTEAIAPSIRQSIGARLLCKFCVLDFPHSRLRTVSDLLNARLSTGVTTN